MGGVDPLRISFDKGTARSGAASCQRLAAGAADMPASVLGRAHRSAAVKLVAERAEEGPIPAPRVRRRVLLVDDDAALRLLYRFNLEASGLTVVEAPDGETALRSLAEELPDVVLLDVMMPGTDGWEVARRLANDARTRRLPIIFITALAEDAVRLRGQELGAVGYLTKPFNPVLLADEIESILTGARSETMIGTND
jgi:two-component system phosphate regulon response regulator PhoB